MNSPLKVIVADDHQLVRKGIVALVGMLDFVEVVREAANGKEVIQWLRSRNEADIALLDLEMPEMNGTETVKALHQEFPEVKPIIITMLPDPDRIREVVKEGARGVLFKTASVQELSEAITRVYNGSTFFTGEVAAVLLTSPTPSLDRLTSREIEILRLIAQGLSSTEIGEKLFISPRTVDTHRNNLIQKLEVNGIAGLVRFAIEKKVV
ncbi:MAG: response regulator transcription factor [Bacteroidia bacterium]|nr:response regulator transcription factor [Bacteroidia bacterium]